MNQAITEKIKAIHGYLDRFKKEDKKVFLSSSFQTHSIPLIDIINRYDNSIPIFFINTGFHFPETHLFVQDLARKMDLNLQIVQSNIAKNQQKDTFGQFLFCSNPNQCCDINKVMPLDPILREYDIWITGVRADQNKNRSTMDFIAKGPHHTTRFHPMIDWNSKDIYEYRKNHDLPAHPLESKGYLSIGCEPCTEKYIDEERSGRWAGRNKNECGLHTQLISK